MPAQSLPSGRWVIRHPLSAPLRRGRVDSIPRVCSWCGVKDGPKPFHVRTWTCGACGTVLDRDTNAALSVAKAAGPAVTACGAQVRQAPAPAQRCAAEPTRSDPHGLCGNRRESRASGLGRMSRQFFLAGVVVADPVLVGVRSLASG
ncbi:zinc ribbon domain-containing protein [Streptomyces sp. NBC_00386]|uniref:zinc ribbon domain-containing protein n=1 Tax=Streptomyces sp. NBC_00386 TaxID=2975734 RepID=UPI003FCE44AD